MGVLGSGGRLSKGMEVMTPAVMARPEASASWPMSKDCTDALLECREEREPDELPGGVDGSPPLSSAGRSLCSFLPKNDLPPDVCLDLSGADDVELGIVAGVAEEAQGAAWASSTRQQQQGPSAAGEGSAPLGRRRRGSRAAVAGMRVLGCQCHPGRFLFLFVCGPSCLDSLTIDGWETRQETGGGCGRKGSLLLFSVSTQATGTKNSVQTVAGPESRGGTRDRSG